MKIKLNQSECVLDDFLEFHPWLKNGVGEAWRVGRVGVVLSLQTDSVMD